MQPHPCRENVNEWQTKDEEHWTPSSQMSVHTSCSILTRRHGKTDSLMRNSMAGPTSAVRPYVPVSCRACAPHCYHKGRGRTIMGANRKYSIWLMPDPASSVNARLQSEISHCAGVLHPDAPVFQPHVTLIGGVSKAEADMIQKTEELAKRLRVRCYYPFRCDA